MQSMTPGLPPPDDRAVWSAPPEFTTALSARYTLEGTLGRGGMGVVYRAVDVRHGRNVAIKVLNPDLVGSAGVQRFVDEIRTLARLQHPRIVPLIDSGEAAGIPYYVMPFIEGPSLCELLAREGQQPIARALSLASDVAAALDYAHSHGVVHRDIKPANVLIHDGRALVLDFGLARAIDPDRGEGLTISGTILGTVHYMSPEQAGGSRLIDGRADVYALACVVFEMLAGEPPFGGTSRQAILAKHMMAPVPEIGVVRSTMPAALQAALGKAMAKSPADRFDTAGAFVRALHEAVEPPPVRWRRRILVGAAVAAAIAAGTLLIGEDGGTAFDERSGPGARASPARVAVLYLDDLSPDSSLRHIAAGLTEQLIQELSGVNLFHVIPRNGVKPFRDRSISVDSIAGILGASTVIDGTVQGLGDRLRVRIRIIDAAASDAVDSVVVDRPASELLAIEELSAQRVAAALRRQMGREVRLKGLMSGTGSQVARELVLRAQGEREDAEKLEAHPHPSDLRAAREALQRADSLLILAERADRNWVRPVLERGWVSYRLSRLAGGDERVTHAEAAIGHSERALRSHASSAEALELRGTARWWLATQLEGAPFDAERMRGAESDLRAAVAADSTRANAWASLSFLLQVKGSFAEASMAASRALREDPFLAEAPAVFVELFFSALMSGAFAEAAEWCRRGRAMVPNDWRFVECELTLLRHDEAAKPDERRAWALVAELDRLDPVDRAAAAGRPYHPIYRRIVAATISARAGDHDRARAELARAMRSTAGNDALELDLAYDAAYLRLVLGEPKEATRLLQTLVTARPMLRPMIERDPLFRELRLTGAFD